MYIYYKANSSLRREISHIREHTYRPRKRLVFMAFTMFTKRAFGEVYIGLRKYKGKGKGPNVFYVARTPLERQRGLSV